MEFEVVEPLMIPDRVFQVDDYLDAAEGSDRGAILLAVEAAAKHGGGTVQFASRHYRDVAGLSPARDTIVLPEGAPIVLRGAGMGGYDWRANPLVISGAGTLLSSAATHTRHPVFELHGREQRVEDMTILVQGTAQAAGPDMEQRISGINLKGPDQKVLRSRLIRSEHCPHWLVMSLYRGAANNEIVGCEFYHAAMGIRIMPGSHFTRIVDCTMRGHYSERRSTDANSVYCNGNNPILENNDFAGLDKTGGRILGRTFLSGNGYTSMAYMAGNRSVHVGSHSSVPGIDGNTSEQYLFHVGDRDGGMFRVVEGDRGGLVLEAAADDMENLGVGVGLTIFSGTDRGGRSCRVSRRRLGALFDAARRCPGPGTRSVCHPIRRVGLASHGGRLLAAGDQVGLGGLLGLRHAVHQVLHVARQDHVADAGRNDRQPQCACRRFGGGLPARSHASSSRHRQTGCPSGMEC